MVEGGGAPPVLESAAATIAAELPALRREIRIRTWVLAGLIAVVLVATVGVSVGGFLWQRTVFCQFFVDLQPPAGAPQPVGEYGQRILNDARTTAARLRC